MVVGATDDTRHQAILGAGAEAGEPLHRMCGRRARNVTAVVGAICPSSATAKRARAP